MFEHSRLTLIGCKLVSSFVVFATFGFAPQCAAQSVPITRLAPCNAVLSGKFVSLSARPIRELAVGRLLIVETAAASRLVVADFRTNTVTPIGRRAAGRIYDGSRPVRPRPRLTVDGRGAIVLVAIEHCCNRADGDTHRSGKCTSLRRRHAGHSHRGIYCGSRPRLSDHLVSCKKAWYKRCDDPESEQRRTRVSLTPTS